MIRLDHVTKSYATSAGLVTALDDFTLEVAKSDYVAVRGHSGSGKSTLLSLVGGLATPTSGDVFVADRNISRMSTAERAKFRAQSIGFVFQMFHLLPYLDVIDNVLVAAMERNADARSRAEQLLDGFGLSPRRSHRPGQLSAGERQRVAMARALLNQPDLLLADEPTGNLDPENTSAVLKIIDEFREAGGTVLLATHDEHAASRAERVITLSRGRLAEDPAPSA